MSRHRRKRPSREVHRFSWQHCILTVLVPPSGPVQYELRGQLSRVSGPNRERAAATLALWLNVGHEAAYARLWGGVSKEWDREVDPPVDEGSEDFTPAR